jgi:hypothetical protein
VALAALGWFTPAVLVWEPCIAALQSLSWTIDVYIGPLVIAGTVLVLFGADDLEITRFLAAAALLARCVFTPVAGDRAHADNGVSTTRGPESLRNTSDNANRLGGC